jgi:hypothetical protein
MELFYEISSDIVSEDTVTFYNWTVDGVFLSNNWDNYTTGWATSGIKTVEVSVTN